MKKYWEFIREYRDITTWKSSTGRSKHVAKIRTEPTTDKSTASSVLLNDKLKVAELDSIIDELNPKIRERIRRFVKKHQIISAHRIKGLMVTFSNEQFLEDEQKKGPLKCEYCNKGPLKIYRLDSHAKFRKHNGATADHKVPQSKDGEVYNYSNLAVCCDSCNQRKGNMTWEDWSDIIPTLKRYS